MSGVGRSRYRVLVLAESCNPEWESVPLVAWSHVEALRDRADVHLVTRSWNRPALDRAGLIEDEDYTVFDTGWLHRPVERLVHAITGPNKGWGMITAFTIPSYVVFELLAWRHFRRRLAALEFDLVHRITPLSPPVPSPIAVRLARIGVPFVLGPLNGALPWPKQFPHLHRREGEFLTRLRHLHRYVPGYRVTRRLAGAGREEETWQAATLAGVGKG